MSVTDVDDKYLQQARDIVSGKYQASSQSAKEKERGKQVSPAICDTPKPLNIRKRIELVIMYLLAGATFGFAFGLAHTFLFLGWICDVVAIFTFLLVVCFDVTANKAPSIFLFVFILAGVLGWQGGHACGTESPEIMTRSSVVTPNTTPEGHWI